MSKSKASKTRRLSLKQLLKKFPALPSKGNCLVDLICPQCGYRDDFEIEVTKVITQFDEGVDDHNDNEYDDSAYCRCGSCEHAGVVGSFRFDGLDAALAAHRISVRIRK